MGDHSPRRRMGGDWTPAHAAGNESGARVRSPAALAMPKKPASAGGLADSVASSGECDDAADDAAAPGAAGRRRFTLSITQRDLLTRLRFSRSFQIVYAASVALAALSIAVAAIFSGAFSPETTSGRWYLRLEAALTLLFALEMAARMFARGPLSYLRHSSLHKAEFAACVACCAIFAAHFGLSVTTKAARIEESLEAVVLAVRYLAQLARLYFFLRNQKAAASVHRGMSMHQYDNPTISAGGKAAASPLAAGPLLRRVPSPVPSPLGDLAADAGSPDYAAAHLLDSPQSTARCMLDSPAIAVLPSPQWGTMPRSTPRAALLLAHTSAPSQTPRQHVASSSLPHPRSPAQLGRTPAAAPERLVPTD